jgi:DNA-binding MarR family transcriptional regulator
MQKKADDLNAHMTVVKEFIDEFYNKTLFQEEANLGSELTASQIRTLFAFRDQNKAYPIGELRKNARVKRSTITVMVDRLERDRLAERVRDKKDRRVVKVQLTAKGKKICKEFYQKRRQEIGAVFSKLKEHEKRELLDCLKRAHQLLKKI